MSTVAEIEKSLQTLPQEYLSEVNDFVEFLKAKVQKQNRRKFPKRPDNPSPSGDPWFDDPKNLALVDERVLAMKEGKSKTVAVLKTKQEVHDFIANL
jgi:hypothetical protein